MSFPYRMNSAILTHLQSLEAESIHIDMREVVAEQREPVVMLYSIGKDSA